MNVSTESLIGITGLAVAALVGFVIYRWRQRVRVHRVKAWIGRYLSNQYGAAPDRLNINCSDDPSWPVLVAFDHPATGLRHDLRFTCAGPASTWSVNAKTDEPYTSTNQPG